MTERSIHPARPPGDIEDVGPGAFNDDEAVFLCSIAISLKRLADYMVPPDDKKMPPLDYIAYLMEGNR